MSILRSAGQEVAGAWRSLRYDLRPRRAQADSPVDGYPDVTSTGLSTFGGGMPGDEYRRRPNRLVAVAAFGLLALAGAAGSYLAVVHGLGAFGVEQATAAPQPQPQPQPLVAEPGPLPPSPAGTAPVAAPVSRRPQPPPPIAAPPVIAAPPAPLVPAAPPAQHAAAPQEASTSVTRPVPSRTLPRTMAPPVPTPASVSPSPAAPAPGPSRSASDGPSRTPSATGSAGGTRVPAGY
jgi:hypothetical protein